MLIKRTFYIWLRDGDAVPVFILNGMPSSPLRSDVDDWFSWREVLPPSTRERKGVKSLVLELGAEHGDYAAKVKMEPITQDYAYLLARDREFRSLTEF